ncbi:MAG: DUF2723 domain-containing protein [bacterium]|nr:DUF2723 domain-containing protein [bacterium]
MSPRWTRRAAALAAFAASLAVYLRTLLPGVGGYGDTSKFQFIGAVFGLPHPSGFPTYIFLNALFARLPWGTLAWRINLMSALFGALAVALLCLLTARLSGDALAALAASLVFAFSFTFWSTCTIAEVYTLAFMLLAATVCALAVWRETGRRRWLYLACALYAVSFGNHLMVIVLIPPFAVLVLATEARIVREPRALAAVALIIILAAAQYLYLPLRTLGGPEYSEGAVRGFGELAWFATGGPFRRHYFEPTLRQAVTVYIPVYARTLAGQIGLAGIALAAAGFVALFRRDRVWGWFLLLLYGTTVALYINGPHIEQPIYFVPATMALAAAIAFAVPRGRLRLPACAAVAALAAWCLADNFPVQDLREKVEYDRAADRVIAAVRPRSIILSPNYHWTEALLYKILGERARAGEDVCVLHHWEPAGLERYRAGEPPTWDPYTPALEREGPFSLYLFALERNPASLARIERMGWRAVPVIEEEHPLVRELLELGPDRMLLLSVRDEGLTILSDEAYDSLQALGLKTRAVAGATFGWAAADAVVRRDGRWRGWMTFRYAPVRLAAGAGTAIPGADAALPADILIRCAGYGRGDRSEILVGGERVSGSRRGLNAAVIDLSTGRVERAVSVPPARLGAVRSVCLYELLPPAGGAGAPGR